MIALILSVFAWAGGDWVGNGASLSENKIFIAFNNLEAYVASALADRVHPLGEADRILLEKIFHSLPNEKRMNPRMIQFKPHSSLFIIDGRAKVAVTGLSPGDTIFFNQDLIHRFDSNNQLSEITLLQAISLLIHELGHHQGITDHTYLDQLGAEVANQSRFEETWFPIHPQIKKLGAQLINPKESLNSSASLHLVDGEKYFDVKEKIATLKLCEDRVSESHLGAINFWNVSWHRPLGTGPQLVGYLAYDCALPNGERFTRIGDQFMVQAVLMKNGAETFFSFSNLQITVYPCEGDGQSCESLKNQYFEAQKTIQVHPQDHFNINGRSI